MPSYVVNSVLFLPLLLVALVQCMPPLASPWAAAYSPGMRRAVIGSSPGPAAFTNFIPSKEGSAAASVPPSNPMFPFMTLKPFLPAKPANPFTPSFVPDPMMFVDKKAELLNNLFSSPMMMGGMAGGAEATSGPSKRALGPTGPAASWAGAAPGGAAASPWAPAPVDPSVFTDKKADFLSKLFSGLGTGKTMGGPGMGMGMVPPGFWMPPPPVPPTTPAPLTEDDPAKFITQLLQALAVPATPATPPILLAPSPTPAKVAIVPPSYWIPTDPLAGPGSYMKKVSDYLDKLFTSLNTTSATPVDETAPSARSVAGKVARHHNDNWVPQTWERAITAAVAAKAPDSIPPASSPLAAKDLVVNSILSEVGELKTAMLDTLNEMILKQKEIAAASVVTKRPPVKFGPFPWGPTPKPTPDPTEPYQKRLETLGQVFDMLTSLGQEVATGGGSPAVNVTTVAPAVPARTARSIEGGMRSVQMAVHQGYQSMPAGTEEVISAGAGRDPTSAHEGGGLNLKIKVPQ